MATCEKCAHEFFFVKVNGAWLPYELTGETFKSTSKDREGDTILVDKPVIQLHQCRREWIREYEKALQVECPSCGAAPGETCTAMSGSYPRAKLKTLIHLPRKPLTT